MTAEKHIFSEGPECITQGDTRGCCCASLAPNRAWLPPHQPLLVAPGPFHHSHLVPCTSQASLDESDPDDSSALRLIANRGVVAAVAWLVSLYTILSFIGAY